MTQHETSRTLVKSAPELWAECSDAASLARHLGAFGEIRITKLEPETTVAWEGTAACGTVRLEPSGWGTRVTMTLTEEETVADPVDADAVAVAEPAAEAGETPSSETEAAVEEVEVDVPVEEVEVEVPAVEVEVALAETDASPARRGLFARLMGRFRGGAPAVPEEPAALVAAEPVVAPEPEQPAEPVAVAEEPVASTEPEPEPVAVEAPDATAEDAPQGEAALAAALDSLGRAHHRPYSRA